LDFLVTFPVFLVLVILSFVVGLVVSILVERVLDAFVEDFFGVIWSIRPFCSGNSVGETEIVEEGGS
jgi:H+/gluconate symporter-like permease